MKTLSETWFADGYIDFEQKKYTLLANLQEIHKYFNENKLYPQLADIIFHYNNLVAFRENKKYLQEQFPKKLNGVQLEKLQILFEQMIQDDELMQELEEIINYATRRDPNAPSPTGPRSMNLWKTSSSSSPSASFPWTATKVISSSAKAPTTIPGFISTVSASLRNTMRSIAASAPNISIAGAATS